MATNKEIKNKHHFIEALIQFQEAKAKFEKELKIFSKNIEDKQTYVDERSDEWAEKENNQIFSSYILDSGTYVTDVEELLNELSNLNLPDLDKYERQETSSNDD